jgi:hypothetical protein
MGIIFLNTPEPIITPATKSTPVNNPNALTRGIDFLSPMILFSEGYFSSMYSLLRKAGQRNK